MIGLIIVLIGIVLIIMGFLFTLFGSRKRSADSTDSTGKSRKYQQHDVRPGHDTEALPDDLSEFRTDDEFRSSVKGGGVVMIGPIPVIFGSDRKTSVVAILLAIILMLLWFVLFR